VNEKYLKGIFSGLFFTSPSPLQRRKPQQVQTAQCVCLMGKAQSRAFSKAEKKLYPVADT